MHRPDLRAVVYEGELYMSLLSDRGDLQHQLHATKQVLWDSDPNRLLCSGSRELKMARWK